MFMLRSGRQCLHDGLSGKADRAWEFCKWLRSKGGGPPYSLLGRSVRYLPSVVLAWAAARCRRSTSDDGLKGPSPEDGDDDDDGTGKPGP